MQEEIIYIPVHITKHMPQEMPAKSIWNTPVRVSKTIQNRLLAVMLIELGILSMVLTGDGTAAFAAFVIAMSVIFSK